MCLLSEDTAVKTDFSLSNDERCVSLCGHEDARCVSFVVSREINAGASINSGSGKKNTSGDGSGSGSTSKSSSSKKRSASDSIEELGQSGYMLSQSGQGRWLKLDCLSGAVLMERTLPSGYI